MGIYRVEVRVKETHETRLVEAAGTAAVLRYIAGQFATVTKCTTSEAIELGSKGVKLEKANGAEPAA